MTQRGRPTLKPMNRLPRLRKRNPWFRRTLQAPELQNRQGREDDPDRGLDNDLSSLLLRQRNERRNVTDRNRRTIIIKTFQSLSGPPSLSASCFTSTHFTKLLITSGPVTTSLPISRIILNQKLENKDQDQNPSLEREIICITIPLDLKVQ